MPFDGEQLIEGAISKAEGLPKESDPKELSLWRRFTYWLRPNLRKNVELGQEYLAAKVLKEVGEAQVKIEEAAKIAAEREKLEAETEIKKQELIAHKFKNIDSSANGSVEAIKMKLGVLLDSSPEILEQLDKVNSLIEKLGWEKGTRIEVVDSEEVEGDVLDEGDDEDGPKFLTGEEES